jgi:predicted glycoside hydrolase/deacetylase ChbG (UPF0249 family)
MAPRLATAYMRSFRDQFCTSSSEPPGSVPMLPRVPARSEALGNRLICRLAMIINADDFGYSSSVNTAILQSFDEGLVSSTTVMANMPAFGEACALAHERDLLSHVGAHIVLTEGQPLTEQILRCRRFCDPDGYFSRRGGKAFWLTRAERNAVALEVRAQIERCRNQGLPLTHLDSHHHSHNEPAIGRIVALAAREFSVAHVRIARNCGPGIDLPRRVYKGYLNRHLESLGLAKTRYFGVVDDYLYLKRNGASSAELRDFEVMAHPVFDARGVLVDGLFPEFSLHDLVTKIDGYTEAVSFVGRRYPRSEGRRVTLTGDRSDR